MPPIKKILNRLVLDSDTRKFHLGRLIGKGTYSKVCTALMSVDNGHEKLVACKIINKREAGAEFTKKFLPREISILRAINHPHMVQFIDIVETSMTVYVFMSYCKYGDLLEYIRRKGSFSERKSKLIFRQIVSALNYLHDQNIAHRDIKCENILLKTKRVIKLGDFGFARYCTHERTGRNFLSCTYCGSAAYAAPEILKGSPYNPKMYDIWSSGCVLYIMLTSEMPFDDSNIRKMIQYQQSRSISLLIFIDMKFSEHLKKLLIGLLEPDVMKRPNIQQVAKSDWLTQHQNKKTN